MTHEELAAKLSTEDRDARKAAVLGLLDYKSGRQFLWWLLQIGKAMGHQPFTTEPLVTAFNCGEMNVGHQILAELIEASPDGFQTLMKEMDDDRRERSDRLARARNDGDAGGAAEHDPWRL